MVRILWIFGKASGSERRKRVGLTVEGMEFPSVLCSHLSPYEANTVSFLSVRTRRCVTSAEP